MAIPSNVTRTRKQDTTMTLRPMRDRTHEKSSQLCAVCALWNDIDGNQIQRPAFWVGRYEDGMRVLVCNNCKACGFPVIGTYHEVNGAPRYAYFGDGDVVAYAIEASDGAMHTCKDLGSAMDAVRYCISHGNAIVNIRSMGSNGLRRAMSAKQRASFVIDAMNA